VRLVKFQHLLEVLGSNEEVVSVSCVGLAGRIEQGNLGSDDVEELIASLVGAYAGKVDAVVLGCTHYPFVRRQIEAVLGDVEFFDSAQGTARQLRRRLEETGLIETREQTGTVSFESSKTNPEELELYRSMFEMSI
jgi:glutamate racemase